MSNHPFSLFGFGVVVRGAGLSGDDAPDGLLILQVGIEVAGPNNETFVCVKESFSDSGAYSYEVIPPTALGLERDWESEKFMFRVKDDWVGRIERFIEDRGLIANVVSGIPAFIHASHFGLPMIAYLTETTLHAQPELHGRLVILGRLAIDKKWRKPDKIHNNVEVHILDPRQIKPGILVIVDCYRGTKLAEEKILEMIRNADESEVFTGVSILIDKKNQAKGTYRVSLNQYCYSKIDLDLELDIKDTPLTAEELSELEQVIDEEP